MARDRKTESVDQLKGLFAGLIHYAGATQDATLATEFALQLTEKTPVYDVAGSGGETRNLSVGVSYRNLAEGAMSYFDDNSVELEQALQEQGIPEPEKAAVLIAKLASFEDAESLPVDEITGTIEAYLKEARKLSPAAQQEKINNLGGIDNVVYIKGGTASTKDADNAHSFKRYQAGTEAFTWFLDTCKKDKTLITDPARLAQTLESKTTPLKNKYEKPVDTLECVNRAVNLAGAANEIDLPMVEKFLQQAGVDHPLEAAKLLAAIREYGLLLERDESEADSRRKALEAVQQSIQRYVDAEKPSVERNQNAVHAVDLALEIEEEMSGTVVEIQQDKAIHAVADVGAVNASKVDVVTHTINQNKTVPSQPSPNQAFSEITDAVIIRMPDTASIGQVSTVSAAPKNATVNPITTPQIIVPAADASNPTQGRFTQPSRSGSLSVQRQEPQPQLNAWHPAYGILGKRTEEERDGKTVYVTPVQDVGGLFGLLKNNPQAVQQVISPSPATATVTSYPLSRADEEKIAAAATQQKRDAQAYADKPNMVRVAYAKQLSAVCGANLNITIGTGAEAFNVKVPLPAATPKAAAMAEKLKDPSLWGKEFDTSGLQNMTQEELASAAVFAAVAEKIKGKNPETQKVELAKLEKLFAAADKNSSFVQYAQQATSQLLAGLNTPRAVDKGAQLDSYVLSVARDFADKSMAG